MLGAALGIALGSESDFAEGPSCCPVPTRAPDSGRKSRSPLEFSAVGLRKWPIVGPAYRGQDLLIRNQRQHVAGSNPAGGFRFFVRVCQTCAIGSNESSRDTRTSRRCPEAASFDGGALFLAFGQGDSVRSRLENRGSHPACSAKPSLAEAGSSFGLLFPLSPLRSLVSTRCRSSGRLGRCRAPAAPYCGPCGLCAGVEVEKGPPGLGRQPLGVCLELSRLGLGVRAEVLEQHAAVRQEYTKGPWIAQPECPRNKTLSGRVSLPSSSLSWIFSKMGGLFIIVMLGP